MLPCVFGRFNLKSKWRKTFDEMTKSKWAEILISRRCYSLLDRPWVCFTQRKNLLNKKKMKIFRIVRKQFAILSITPPKSQKFSFDGKLCYGYVSIGCNFISQLVYTIYVADGFMEIMESVCSTSGMVIQFVCFATIASKRALLFQTIENIENLIDTSTIQCFLFTMNSMRF